MAKNIFDKRTVHMGFENVAVGVNGLINGAPRGIGVREFIQNAFEASIHKNETIRNIYIDETSTGAMVMSNSCVGLSLDELQTELTNLSASGTYKSQGTKAEDNRGEGAKISNLKFHKLQFTTRKNKILSRLTIEKSDNDNIAPKCDLWHLLESGLTDEEKQRYSRFNSDFFEVVASGLEEDDKPFSNYYSDINKKDQVVCYHEILNRYYDFPLINKTGKIAPRVIVNNNLEIKPTKQLIQNNLSGFENPENSFVTITKGPFAGIVIEYAYAKNQQIWAKYTGKVGGRVVLVWGNEYYDTISFLEWNALCPNYGLFGTASNLTVFVHIPDNFDVCPDKYRINLINNTNGKNKKKKLPFANSAVLNVKMFKDLIREHRPEWLKKIVQDKMNINDSKADMKEITNFLRQWNTYISSLNLEDDHNFVVKDDDKVIHMKSSRPDIDEDQKQKPKNKNINPGPKPSVINVNKEVFRAPSTNKKSNVPLEMPRFIPVNEPNENYTAKYASPPVNEFYLNVASTGYKKILNEAINLFISRTKDSDITPNIATLIEHLVQKHIRDKAFYYIIQCLGNAMINKFDDKQTEEILNEHSLSAVVEICAMGHDIKTIVTSVITNPHYKSLKKDR